MHLIPVHLISRIARMPHVVDSLLGSIAGILQRVFSEDDLFGEDDLAKFGAYGRRS
jgi:hypothetical protein